MVLMNDSDLIETIGTRLVSIHKWPFFRRAAFSAGFGLRRTKSTYRHNPLCGLAHRKKSSLMNWKHPFVPNLILPNRGRALDYIIFAYERIPKRNCETIPFPSNTDEHFPLTPLFRRHPDDIDLILNAQR